jgi:hypothetical protein
MLVGVLSTIGMIGGFGSAGMSASYTTRTNEAIGHRHTENGSQNLASIRGGMSTSIDGIPTFGISGENYSLNPATMRTTVGYVGILTSADRWENNDNRTSNLAAPFSVNIGMMFGLNKYKNAQEDYFAFTRNDTYLKFGMSTDFAKVEDIYVGVDKWQGPIKMFANVGLKNKGGQFRPGLGCGISLNMEFV